MRANDLQNTLRNDKVGSVNEKPPAKTGGQNPSDSAPGQHLESKDGCYHDSILPDAPNLYKQKGASMSRIFPCNYTTIPNVVFDYWMEKLSPAEFKVLLCICRKTFGWSKVRDSISFNQIVDMTGLARNSVISSLNVLIDNGLIHKTKSTDGVINNANQYEIIVHEITNTQTDNRDSQGGGSATIAPGGSAIVAPGGSAIVAPGVVQSLHPQKKDHTKETLISNVAVAGAPAKEREISSSSQKRKKVPPAPLVERDTGVFTSDIAHEKLLKEKGSEQAVKEIYSAMAIWKAQTGIQGGDDYRTALNWSLTPKNSARTYSKPAQPKYNHDTSPSLPSKSISFADEV